MTMLAAIVGEPRGQNFLESRQCAGGDHFRSEGVLLQLLEVCLKVWLLTFHDTLFTQQEGISYSQVAGLSLSTSQALSNFVSDILVSGTWDRSCPDGLLLKFDRHVVL